MQTVSVVIVDLDNTLWDWVKIWGASFGAMLERVAADSGISVDVLKAEFKAVHQRHGTSEYAFSLEELPSLQQKHPNGDIPAVYAGAVEAFRDTRRLHLGLYPGVFDTLQDLKDRGCLLVGYTESMAFYSAYRLIRTELDRVLDYLYSPEDHDLPQGMTLEQIRQYPASRYRPRRTVHRNTPKGELKPNAKVLRAILSELGVLASEAVYVGDSLMKDVAMAQAAGVTDVLAEYGAAHGSAEYALLKEVTHWTPAMVAKEAALNAGTSKDAVTPTYVLKTGFAEILGLFNFVGFDGPNAPSRDRDAVMEIWKTTVGVQQHFNDIEMKVRSLAVTMFATVMSAAAITHQAGWEIEAMGSLVPLSTVIIFVGAMAWLAFYMMEQYWYHVFLKAAGMHAAFIESRWRRVLPELGLSTRIGESSRVFFPDWPAWLRSLVGRKYTSTERLRYFYLGGLAIFALAGFASYGAHLSTEAAARAAQQMTPTAPPVQPPSAPAHSAPTPPPTPTRAPTAPVEAAPVQAPPTPTPKAPRTSDAAPTKGEPR